MHIDKPNFGWLGWKELGLEKYEAVELVGLCTDICVISNAVVLKAAFPEVPIAVDAACCAGVTMTSHRIALEAMRAVQIGIKE